MSAALDEARRLTALRERTLAAADFPRNTCPASRHVHDAAVELVSGRLPPALEDDDALAHLGANMLAVVAALWEARAGRASPGDAGDVLALCDRLAASVEALANQRDAACAWGSAQQDAWLQEAKARRQAQEAGALSKMENEDLRDRVARAVVELDGAPDADPERPSKRQTKALAEASTRAWTVLTEGRHPPSVRRAEHAPRDAGEDGA